jgi:hypothetical protein
MRKQLIAIVAGMALGAAGIATPALAGHGGGGGGHGGGGGGGHFGGGGHPGGFGGGHAGGFGGGARSAVSPQANVGGNFAMARSNPAINHTVLPNASPQVHGNFAANNYAHSGNWNHGHWNRGYGYGGGVYAFGGYGPYYGYGPDYYASSDDGYSNGCLQQQYVQTVYGPQLQWVDVCQ